MMRKWEIIDWMKDFPDGAEIAIGEGGLALVVVGTNEGIYLEVGGEPEEEEESE